jgi:Tetratricopeptide repeat
MLQDDHAQAEANHREGLVMNREMGDRVAVAASLEFLGSTMFAKGDYRAAEVFLQEALAIRRETHSQFLYLTLGWLVRTVSRLGLPAVARTYLRDGLTVVRATSSAREKLWMLFGAAEVLLAERQVALAAELIGLQLTHPANDHTDQLYAEQVRSDLAARITPTELAKALERGSALDIDAVIAQLLAE